MEWSKLSCRECGTAANRFAFGLVTFGCGSTLEAGCGPEPRADGEFHQSGACASGLAVARLGRRIEELQEELREAREVRPQEPSRVRDGTMGLIEAEVARARAKFPAGRHLMVALTEEVGELAEALLKTEEEGDLSSHRVNTDVSRRARVREEAVQVACVAIRIIEEGDADFPGSVPGEGEVG